MAEVKKIIEEILLEHSVDYPIPSLNDKEQIDNLMDCCDRLGYSEYKQIISETFLNKTPIKNTPIVTQPIVEEVKEEIPQPKIEEPIIEVVESKIPTTIQYDGITIDQLLESLLIEEEGKGESKEFPGKYHLGGGYYSSKQGGDVQFKNDNGNLRPVTPEEKAEFDKKASGGEEEKPAEKPTEQPTDKPQDNPTTPTAEKPSTPQQPTEQPAVKPEMSPEDKQKEDRIKNEPEKVLNDPEASAKDRARARAFKSEKDNLKTRRENDPEYQTELKKDVQTKLTDISKELRDQTDSDGNKLDSEITENGSILIGVEHGDDTDTTKNIINKITSLPKDAKVVFVGEGGSSYDENGRIEFNGEQKEIRDAYMNHFDSPKEESWDENADITDSDSQVFEDVANAFGGDKQKAMASIWTNMVGQGDDLNADDYLTDETKNWIVDQAKKGGSDEFNGDVDWNNLSLEQKEDLYQLNYRDDQNYGETELSTGQKAYNNFRQKELDRKIKEVEKTGGIAIATMGNSHVAGWRERNAPKKDTFNPSSLRTLGKEMPEADKDVFNKTSDIDKIPEDKKKEISMKIDELADKANKGEDFNLCQITVPGTNLYCDDNQGIPREEMPQFKGKPLPGTPAESMPKDSKGEVDTEPLFKKMLKEKGIKTIETEVPSDKLKATQSELVGSKVAGMTKALEEDPNNPGITAPIYVSRDGFVIDGHHRWAAVTSNAIKAGKPANMKVIVVDMDIKDAIPMCNQFAEEQGIAAKKADANDGNLPKPKKADETPNGRVYSVGGNYYSDTPNGPAQYIKTESVIEKIFIEEDINFFNLIFEKVVTKVDGNGDPIKLTVIEPKDQPDATQKADVADGGDSTSTPTTSSIGDAIFSTSKAKGDDKKKAFVEKKKGELNKLLFSMADDNNNLNLLSEPGGSPVSIKIEDLTKVIDKIFSGDSLNDEEKKLFNSCVKLVTNPTNGDVKVYVSSKFAGRHPQQGYKSIEIAKENIPMGDAIRKYALDNGLNVGKSSEGAIGKKVLNPVKMASSVNPENPEAIVEIKKSANGVMIGGKEMKRLKELNYDELVKTLTPKYGPEEAAKKAKLLVLQTKAYNQKLDDLAKIGEASDGKIPMANFGDVTSPEGRKETNSNILNGCIKRFETELDNFGKQFGKPDLKNTPENKKIFDNLNRLKELNEKNNLETDENVRAEYKAALDQLLIDMANSPDFKDSVADFAEIKAGLQFLAEGKQVYFPSSENFQTADIIVMPDEFSVKPKNGQTTEEAIAENLQFYSVTVTYVGGLSVKYKGGGGSANYSKIEQTEYNNPETKSRLLGIQDIYTLAYPKDKANQLNIQDSDIETATKKLDETIQWAIDSNLITKDEAELIKKIGQGQANNTLKGALKDVARCEGSNRDNFEKSIALHHTMLHLTAVLNNKDMAYTRFSNFNEEVSQNKDGQATKIKDDIADGVNKPCYMNPHHNPGFEVKEDSNGCMTGAPTNQNPSHIESEPPKNLLKAPK